MRHSKLMGLMTPIERIGRVAANAYDAATAPQTAPSGSISLDNADGTKTIIGPQAGSGDGAPSGQAIATHVGDVTPPPVPTGIRAWSGDGSLHVLWAGSLDGDVPADFDHVTILVDGSPVAEMRSAGSVTVDGLAVGSTVSVTATAEDDACLADGTPAHNVSAPSAALAVEIRDAVAEVRADADAHGKQIDAVKQDIADFKQSAQATYATKTEVDEKTKAVTESIEATYLKKDDASTTYATKTELLKSADGIRSEVSEEYVTKDDAAKAYVGKSTFEQDSRKIATTVTSELTTGWTAWADDSTGKNMVLGNTYPGAKTAPGGTEHPVDVDNMAFIGSAKVLSSEQPTSAASYDWIPNSTKTMRTRIEQTSDRVDTAITDIDGISTLIRQDSTGITVGKSADGKAYSTGRTHIGTESFDVLDKSGNVVATFGGAAISMLMGLLTIAAGQGSEGVIYPANDGNLMLKSGEDAEIAGKRGSYIEVNDSYAAINSKAASGATNSLTVDNVGIYAQTQGVGGLLLCPVHSMYNPNNGAHAYTGKASEISSMKSAGWTDEGAKFYAFLSPGNR